MTIEMMLNAVNLNFVAFNRVGDVGGQVFALFVITIAAAELGVGLAIVLLIYRNRFTVELDEIDWMKGEPVLDMVPAPGHGGRGGR